MLVKFNNLSMFVVKYKEAWVEEGLLLITQEYCKYGDLLDFLQNLEDNNFVFNADFYWDIIFQMISVSYNI
jgi:serine/threonine protein kinase